MYRIVNIGTKRICGQRLKVSRVLFSVATNPCRYFSSSDDIPGSIRDIGHNNTNNNTSDNSINPLSDEWIPPNRPLSGDQGYQAEPEDAITSPAIEEALFVIDENDSEEEIQRKLEAVLKLEEELEQQQFQKALEREERSQQEAPDWLATRRTALGKRMEDSARAIPVREHELITQQEFVSFLEYHEGIDVQVLLDNPISPRMGGAEGMIICEASSLFHIQSITRALIDHLKERKLHEVGVLGAQMGSNRSLHSSNWNVVDCDNYLVHILDAPTRRAVQLEKLWSGKDPLWKLNIGNEDDVDRYVEQNPVPATYGQTDQSSWDFGKLERNQFAPHSPIVSSSQKQEDRRAGRRKRRQLRQGFS